MTDPIGPVDRTSRPRRVGRRAGVSGRRATDAQIPNLPVKLSTPANEPASQQPSGAATFAAQIMGQSGQKRGLRGGPETLDHARGAYLEAEWSGPADRRIARGRITKTEI
jgi:hypothetical protein